MTITGIVCLFDIFATLLTQMGSGVVFRRNNKKQRNMCAISTYSDACTRSSHLIMATAITSIIIQDKNQKSNTKINKSLIPFAGEGVARMRRGSGK